MKREFIRTLILVVTTCVLVSAFVCIDSFREIEAGYIQGEMLKAPSENVGTRPNRKVLYPTLDAVFGRSRFSRGSALMLKSPALVSLSTCVLLC
jgi:hypothetical protein